ncbi:MAG: hypothetical protein JXN60_05895, partial [Lentisphaerae bacterium]|nr:hypothetical protein [Lentisphaerota bacterium]
IEKLESGETIDFDGHPFPQKLYRTLLNIDLTRVAPTVQTNVLVVSVTHSSQPQTEDTRLVSAFPSADSKAVRLQPFWNLIGYVDSTPLREITLEWLINLSNVSKLEIKL